ncbi:expressed unknown protein [Seminavis robusta]|uniref:Uncharacterized protein n=1 Tax=Seminavis robusta TaxID=568900 RepID=A0A9N8H7D2_9STRA|nr:expressed unknown protein [Seminavis robusta]|eukprot:Sro65_g036990.1 n/a (169) ;mRNA; r:127552-128058
MWRLSVALYLLYQAANIPSAIGFAPAGGGFMLTFEKSSVDTHYHREAKPRKTQKLWMSDIENDNNTSNHMQTEETPDTETTPEARKRVLPEPVRQVMKFLDDAYSVFTIFFGAYFAVGILLNLCGYGYRLSKDGYEIDTIQHIRMENQFKRAAQEMAPEHQPPSALPK